MVEYTFDELREKASIGGQEALNDLVDHLYENKEYQKAFMYAQRFFYMPNADGLRKLGFFYERGIGTEINIEKAKECYSKAFELGDVISSYNLALIYLREENVEKCIYYLSIGKYYEYIPSIKKLAELYFKGEKIEKNLSIAIELFKILLEKVEIIYLDYIGRAYYQLEDYYLAFEYFKKGSEVPLLESIYHLAICYSKGKGTGVDVAKAVALYKLGSEKGHPGCIHNLAIHYKKGIGVEKDIEKANELMKLYEDKKSFNND